MLDAGFNFIHWDGRDAAGDEIARGIYIYQIAARDPYSGKKIEKTGKMVKGR